MLNTPTAYGGPNMGRGWISNQVLYHHPGNQRAFSTQGYNNRFVSCDIKSKPTWERIPTIREKVHILNLLAPRRIRSPLPADALFEDDPSKDP
jgi:hypothetical protein